MQLKIKEIYFLFPPTITGGEPAPDPEAETSTTSLSRNNLNKT